jgi:hypothetical protein
VKALQLGVRSAGRRDGVASQAVIVSGGLDLGGARAVQEHEVAPLAARHVIEEVANVPRGARSRRCRWLARAAASRCRKVVVSVAGSIEGVYE